MTNARTPERLLRLVAALAVAFGGASIARALTADPPPARVTTDRARMQDVERRKAVTGELRAPVRATIASAQAGLVVQVNCEPGDRIEAGKVIAKLDDRTARLTLAQAEANLTSRQALVSERRGLADKARRFAERCEAAFKASGATESDVDNARTALAEAESRLAQAQADAAWADADVSLARKRLGDLTIRAPFTGVVAAKRTETGQWLAEGGAVIDLVALDRLDAWLDVPEGLADRLRPPGGARDPAALTVQLQIPALHASTIAGADRPVSLIEAPIAGVIPSADPTSRNLSVRVRIDNKDGRLLPGMSVIGLVPLGSKGPALTVSRDALRSNDTGLFVYFDSGGRVAASPVTILCAVGDRVAVSAALLSDGTDVIVTSDGRLSLDQPLVRVAGPAPGGPEGAAAKPAR